MKKLLSLFLLPVLLLGCGPSAKEKSISNKIIEKSQNTSDNVDNNQRKIIQEGSLRFRTGDIEETNG